MTINELPDPNVEYPIYRPHTRNLCAEHRIEKHQYKDCQKDYQTYKWHDLRFLFLLAIKKLGNEGFDNFVRHTYDQWNAEKKCIVCELNKLPDYKKEVKPGFLTRILRSLGYDKK